MTSILAKIGQTIAFFNHQDQERQQIVEQAHNWQRKPEPSQQKKPPVRVDLAKLPGYEHGMYARRYHQRIEDAIQAAMSPDLSKIATLIKQPQNTNPLPARDIERANTSQDVSQIATLKNNPATPTHEMRAALFAEGVPDVAESLVLWEPDPDATDHRVIVRRHDGPRNTINMRSVSILEMMAGTHEQSTGENERLPVPENFLL